MTFGEKVIDFNKNLNFQGDDLPFGIKIMNPFKSDSEILNNTKSFYTKFYNDTNPRSLILGINPGRLGAGVTGIPFTDTKRLSEICGIDMKRIRTHEPSSVFIYDLIEDFGGVDDFYDRYYISSVCPLGFIRQSHKGNWVNCNYYDFPELFKEMYGFIVASLKMQISFGIKTDKVFVLGKENAKWLDSINSKERLFEKVMAFEHPRYVMQYKSKEKKEYIAKFLSDLK